MKQLMLALAALALATPAAAQTPLRDGATIYNDKCVYCHAERQWGTRELAKRTEEGQSKLLDRKDLTADFVAAAVRRGVGSMPPFTPTDLSDAEVNVLAKWLEANSNR